MNIIYICIHSSLNYNKKMNKNNISLIPLLEDKNTAEALQLIESENFNIHEVSELGNNLFKLAFFYREFEVAEKLLQLDYNKKIFQLNIDTKISTLIIHHILDNLEESAYVMKKYTQFMKKNNITLSIDFKKIWEELLTYNFNLEELKKTDNINQLKFFFTNSIEEIKNLDYKETIILLAQFKSPNLIKMYYDLLEFDKLPIQEHPSFSTLKDVVVNSEKYFDYKIFSENKNLTDIKNNINDETILKIKNTFEKINTSKDFNQYFKKGRDFLTDLHKIQKTSNSLISDHSKETKNILNAVNHLDEGIFIENSDKYLEYYLVNWPIYYFDKKYYINKNNTKEVFQNKIDTIVKKYSFNSILVHKSINEKNFVKVLEECIKETKSFFNLNDNEVGNNEINLIFEKKVINNMVLGEFNSANNIIYISSGEKNQTSTFIHEYTHYLQYKDTKFIKDLKKVKELSQEWINYETEDFAELLFNNFKKSYGSIFITNQKDNWLKILVKLIKSSENEKIFVEKIKVKSKSLFKLDLVYEIFKDFILSNEILKINAFYTSQKNKDYSFEYYLWEALDNDIFKKNKKEYWGKPLEIHARLNEEIYNNNMNKFGNINPGKLKQMKIMIEGFNQLFIGELENRKSNKLSI